MKTFWRLYRWGMDLKLYMAMYALALLLVKGIYGLLAGSDSIPVLQIFEMVFAGLGLALLQRIFFPDGKELIGRRLAARTALWAISANAFAITLSTLFHWFPGAPLWAGLLLTFMLNGGLAAMWCGIHIALKLDTRRLNDGLQAYQKGE